MSKCYKFENLPAGTKRDSHPQFGRARGNQPTGDLESNFDNDALLYLDEGVINHLVDSLVLENATKNRFDGIFNDFSFYTAPAYKAFEGFLFQIAKDLDLPSSGNPKFAGTYFDEEIVDKTIDKLIKELATKAGEDQKLDKQEKMHIKDMISEMKRFLLHYRHTPAHFHGESINTLQKAHQNILSIYRIINETVRVLLKTKLVEIQEGVH